MKHFFFSLSSHLRLKPSIFNTFYSFILFTQILSKNVYADTLASRSKKGYHAGRGVDILWTF